MSSNVDIKSMFDSIKESLNVEKQSGNSSFKDILKLEVGKTYIVRFIPNIKDPKNTFFHYSHHGWTSLSTGQYVDSICLRTFGERCPICESRFKLYKTKKPEDKELASLIKPYDKHLVNVYVISDPTTPDNEGKIKILRFGKRIYDKILDATEGDDADEFGHRIYNLSENGCSFKIKVESSSDSPGSRKFTNYNNSRFMAPSAIPNMTSEKIKEVYDNIFDLTKMIEPKTEADLVSTLNTHLLSVEGKAKKKSEPVQEVVEENKGEDNDALITKEVDDIPMNDTPPAKATTASKDNASQDAKIKSLLDGLDTL